MTNPRGVALLLLAGLVCGCASTRASAPTAPAPTGPPELVRLSMLTGVWEGTSRSTPTGAGQALESRSRAVVRWVSGGRALQEETEVEMGGFAASMTIGIWTWNPEAEVYRYRRSSEIWNEEGTATYDEASRTWNLESQSTHVDTGRQMRGNGSMRYVEDDHKILEWTAYDVDEGEELYRFEGESRRTSP